MQTKLERYIWITAVFGWICLPSISKAQRAQTHSVCGIEVLDANCRKQVKKLEQGCLADPRIANHSLKTGVLPKLGTAAKWYMQMYRDKDIRWLKGLCGVTLYSRPETSCGKQGLQVALACIRSHRERLATESANQKMTSASDTVQDRKATVPQPPNAYMRSGSERAISPSAVQKIGVPHKEPASKAPKSPPVKSAVSVNETSAEAAHNSISIWFWLIQIAILILVLFLLWRFHQRSPSSMRTRDWQNLGREDNLWEQVQIYTGAIGRIENALDQIELNMHLWKKKWQELKQQEEPLVSLQHWADALYAYYRQLAQQILVQRNKPSASHYQRQLLNARDNLAWLFESHRELPPRNAMIEKLRQKMLNKIDALLTQMGYAEDEQQMQKILAQGQFNVQEFIARKTTDQAQRFLQEQKLQSFINIRSEFLQCLEQLYRSNLELLRNTDIDKPAVSLVNQQQNYIEEYIMAFLLQELPMLMLDYTSQSSRECSGALSEQLFNFIVEELADAGLAITPAFDAQRSHSHCAKFQYLSKAGVVMIEQPTTILREPDVALLVQDLAMSSHSKGIGNNIAQQEIADDSEEQANIKTPSGLEIAGITKTQEFKSVENIEDSLQGSLESNREQHVSAAGSTLEFRQRSRSSSKDDLFEIISQTPDHVLDQSDVAHNSMNPNIPLISNPDSDPPNEQNITRSQVPPTEQLPPGPLPTFDMTAISPANNSPTDTKSKKTAEYAIEHTSEFTVSPDISQGTSKSHQ
jgi:hypothetical protein